MQYPRLGQRRMPRQAQRQPRFPKRFRLPPASAAVPVADPASDAVPVADAASDAAPAPAPGAAVSVPVSVWATVVSTSVTGADPVLWANTGPAASISRAARTARHRTARHRTARYRIGKPMALNISLFGPLSRSPTGQRPSAHQTRPSNWPTPQGGPLSQVPFLGTCRILLRRVLDKAAQ